MGFRVRFRRALTRSSQAAPGSWWLFCRTPGFGTVRRRPVRGARRAEACDRGGFVLFLSTNVRPKLLGGPFMSTETPDKTNFRGALRSPLAEFRPHVTQLQIFVRTHARVRPGPGQIATARKRSLACLFWPRPNVVSHATGSTHTSLFVPSACNGVRTAPGLQHCCECARSARRNFRVSLRGTADFRPPVTLYAV